jgi:hypothetical protein
MITQFFKSKAFALTLLAIALASCSEDNIPQQIAKEDSYFSYQVNGKRKVEHTGVDRMGTDHSIVQLIATTHYPDQNFSHVSLYTPDVQINLKVPDTKPGKFVLNGLEKDAFYVEFATADTPIKTFDCTHTALPKCTEAKSYIEIEKFGGVSEYVSGHYKITLCEQYSNDCRKLEGEFNAARHPDVSNSG